MTRLPSFRHCDEDGFWSLAVDCWVGAGPSCSFGFSTFRARRSLMRGRYTVPSWALHRRIRMDRGRPLSRDRTVPAWRNERKRNEASFEACWQLQDFNVCEGCDWPASHWFEQKEKTHRTHRKRAVLSVPEEHNHLPILHGLFENHYWLSAHWASFIMLYYNSSTPVGLELLSHIVKCHISQKTQKQATLYLKKILKITSSRLSFLHMFFVIGFGLISASNVYYVI